MEKIYNVKSDTIKSVVDSFNIIDKTSRRKVLQRLSFLNEHLYNIEIFNENSKSSKIISVIKLPSHQKYYIEDSIKIFNDILNRASSISKCTDLNTHSDNL